MGCDYYTWIETIIVYKDISGVIRKFIDKEERQKRYVYEDNTDTDFQSLPSIADQLNTEICDYGKKKMFMDTYWLCTYNGKSRIRELCEANEIPLTSLVEVYKQMQGCLR